MAGLVGAGGRHRLGQVGEGARVGQRRQHAGAERGPVEVHGRRVVPLQRVAVVALHVRDRGRACGPGTGFNRGARLLEVLRRLEAVSLLTIGGDALSFLRYWYGTPKTKYLKSLQEDRKLCDKLTCKVKLYVHCNTIVYHLLHCTV